MSLPMDFLSGVALPDEDICALLNPAGFADWRNASLRLQHLVNNPDARVSLATCLPYLITELSNTTSPDAVLVSLERFNASFGNPASLFQYLANDPRAIQVLVTLFSSSQFLTEILLRSPDYFYHLVPSASLAQIQSGDTIFKSAMAAVEDYSSYTDILDALRRFQRWELLRIGTCDLLGMFDLGAVTGQLSNLADGIIRACLTIVFQQTNPHSSDVQEWPLGFCAFAMGKLGGRELNYSSDIDLLFIAASDDALYRRLGEKLIDALSSVTDEGFLYRVDMRLRPWGRAGALVPSTEGYLAYLKNSSRLWEKQALLKARCVAGDMRLGVNLLHQVSTLIFTTTSDEVRTQVFLMKQRTETYLRQQGRTWGEVKLGEGSIRDIEFVTQYLQLIYAAKQPELRSRNTLEALQQLTRFGFITPEDSRILSDGYIFLRTVEHHLQMMHYRQTDTLPSDTLALTNLSRRLGFQDRTTGELFVTRYQEHCTAIRSIYLKFMGVQVMEKTDQPATTSPEVRRHIDRLPPSYQSTFSPADIIRHASLAELLDADRLVQVDTTPLEDGRWRVTIVAYDYPGELSLICGLMFVYGLDISDGNVFTYEPLNGPKQVYPNRSTTRKIVDVFTVQPASTPLKAGFWKHYSEDLADLLRLTRHGDRQEARLHLARRVAEGLQEVKEGYTAPLYPIDISIDNDVSPVYTILRISAIDSIGFLYELTNALAFNQVYIARVEIETFGARVHDTLYVTGSDGKKVTNPNRQRELRAATVLIKHFTHLLPLSPDPEEAMVHFHEFTGELFRRENWPDELASLERPEVLSALAQLLGVSDFLWHDFLRMQHANLFPVVSNVESLAAAKPRAQLENELEAALSAVQPSLQPINENFPWRSELNAFKDREMFRIDMRHILGITQEFGEFSEELTGLAEVVVNAAFNLTIMNLNSIYGLPLLEDNSLAPMVVCALGKCGGRELGFASDIELMFIYTGNGKTSGPEIITTAEFYEKAVENFVSAIEARREGIFEIDLQLRPYGKAGSLAVSLEAFRRYFSPQGSAWAYERQALVKLRPIAGDKNLGELTTSLRDAYIYSGMTFDITAMRAMRERQIRHLVIGGSFNPKFSPGGLVDIEYLVQALQIIHGAKNPGLRSTNTRQAMTALAEANILTSDDYTQLRKAYTFFRWLIDSLRMVAGNAKDLVIPDVNSEEFAYLARRLRYSGDRASLSTDLLRYANAVQEINRRLLAAPKLF